MENQFITAEDARRIYQEEFEKNYRSGVPVVAPHTHDGNNGVQLQQSDITQTIKGNGTITMSQSTTYKLKLGKYGLTPTSVTFYGGALTTTGSGQHAMVVGNAQLGNNQQFQPQGTTAVILGPVQTSIIQGSASILIDDSNVNNTVIRNSEDHIVYVQDIASTIVALADVTAFSNSEITITTELVAGWSISGLWIVT